MQAEVLSTAKTGVSHSENGAKTHSSKRISSSLLTPLNTSVTGCESTMESTEDRHDGCTSIEVESTADSHGSENCENVNQECSDGGNDVTNINPPSHSMTTIDTDQSPPIAEDRSCTTTIEVPPGGTIPDGRDELVILPKTMFPTYVNTLEEAEDALHRFENNTKTRFCVWRSPKDFGLSQVDLKSKRLYWHEFILEDRVTVTSNGTPFVMMGRKVYDCHHGRDRNLAVKQRQMLKRQENDVKKRNINTPSPKVNCPARVVFCEIIYFPDYQLETDTKHYRNAVAKTMRQHFADGLVNLENIERRIYLCFPTDNEHKGHSIGQLDTKLSHRVDPKVSSKITKLVSTGLTSEREMRYQLDRYICRELFPGRGKPFHSNRRYYPYGSVVRLKMYNARILASLSLIDLENIEEAMALWMNNSPNDKFHFRRYTDVDESFFDGTKAVRFAVDDDDGDDIKIRQRVAKEHFLFVHQTSFQRHLLKRYGNDVVFLDPVHRTIKYAVPLFFVTVKTNCDHQIVAEFGLQNEHSDSIVEALTLLKTWNPGWKPKIFMVDNDSEEIDAIKDTFPGCKVFLSDFHREQAWMHWLSLASSGVQPYKNAILIYLRQLASATTGDEFHNALEELQESDAWTSEFNTAFRSWFENMWLIRKELWVWSYKVNALSSVLTTNNTLEYQNQEFKHQQLIDQENTPLSDLLKVLIHDILPIKRNSYLQQNEPSSSTTELPRFFRRRPRALLDRVVETTNESYDITSQEIVLGSASEGKFCVTCLDSDLEYNVKFGDDERLPRCECRDWLTTMLPCKHFMTIVRNYSEWDWSKFPEFYKSSVYLTLDGDVGRYVSELNTNSSEVTPMLTESTTMAPDDSPKLTGGHPELIEDGSKSSTTTTGNLTLTNQCSNSTELEPHSDKVSVSTEVNPSGTEVNPSGTEVNPSGTEVNPNVSSEEDNEDNSELGLDGGLVSKLFLQKQGRKSTALRCRELLMEINNMTYVVYNRDYLSSLLSGLKETLSHLKLTAPDDDDVECSDGDDRKTVKHEVKHGIQVSVKKHGKRTHESPVQPGSATKSLKLDNASRGAQTAVSHTGDEILNGDNQVFGDTELLNLGDCSRLADTGGTAGSIQGTEGSVGITSGSQGSTLAFSMNLVSEETVGNTSGTAESLGSTSGRECSSLTSPLGQTSRTVGNSSGTGGSVGNTSSGHDSTVPSSPLSDSEGTVRNSSGTPDSIARIPYFNSGQASYETGDSSMLEEFTALNENQDGEPSTTTQSRTTFSKHEENIILRNEMLNYVAINFAQDLLRQVAQPAVQGLQSVARGAVQTFEPVSGDFIQILYDGNLHWVCTSNVALGVNKDPAAVSMYDSMNQGFIAKFTKQQLASFLSIQSAEMKVIMRSVQQQNNTVDCGVFAIAFATALAFGQDPCKQRFDVPKMRAHLVECLKSKQMSPFPEVKEGAGDDVLLSKRKFFTIELFCSCRMPYEKPKSEADLVAQCGSCKEWFHQRCEKIALEIFKASGQNFMCSSCLKR